MFAIMMERVSSLTVILQLTLLCSSLRGYNTQGLTCQLCQDVTEDGQCGDSEDGIFRSCGTETSICISVNVTLRGLGTAITQASVGCTDVDMFTVKDGCVSAAEYIAAFNLDGVFVASESSGIACLCNTGDFCNNITGTLQAKEITVTDLPTTELNLGEAMATEIDTELPFSTGIDDQLTTELLSSTIELETLLPTAQTTKPQANHPLIGLTCQLCQDVTEDGQCGDSEDGRFRSCGTETSICISVNVTLRGPGSAITQASVGCTDVDMFTVNDGCVSVAEYIAAFNLDGVFMASESSGRACLCNTGDFCNNITGTLQAKSDVCTSVLPICKNGGTCLEQGNGLPTCACPSGYLGARCQLQDAELCMLLQPHFCMNGGSCIVKDTAEGREVACDCAEGFSGLRCEEEANAVTYLPTTELKSEEATVTEIDTLLPLETDIDDLLTTQLKSSTAGLETLLMTTDLNVEGTTYPEEAMTKLDNMILSSTDVDTETETYSSTTPIPADEIEIGTDISTVATYYSSIMNSYQDATTPRAEDGLDTVIPSEELLTVTEAVPAETEPPPRTSTIFGTRLRSFTSSLTTATFSSGGTSKLGNVATSTLVSTITPIITARTLPTTQTTKAQANNPLIATESPHIYEEELKNITADLTRENITMVEASEAAEKIVEIAKNDTFLSEKPERVGLVIESLESIVDTGFATENITEPVVDIINNLLDLDEAVIAEGTSEGGRAVAALEKLVENIQEEEGNVTIVRENIGVTAVKVEEGNLDGNLVFAVVDQESSPDGNERVGDRSLTTELYDDEDQLGPVAKPTTVIAIPREVIESFGEEDNSTAVPISFIVYKNDLLFTPSMPSKNFSEEEEEDITEMIASHVISARIKNKDGERHLKPPIVAKFRLDVVLNATSTKHCVSWDYDDKTRQGSWTEDGCQMRKDEADYTVCECTRFASFAILVRVDNGDIVLYYITVVGSIISAICLILCLITFVSLKSLRSKQPTHIHINLCASLLGFYIAFMLGIPAARDTGLCRAASAATHFFSLATIAWMTAEAVNMYFLFVKMERRGIKYFIPIASLLTYGLSAVCVVLTIFFDKKTQFERASYCFIQPGNALYFGFLVEVAALFAFNFFIFMWVIRKMLCRPLMVSNTKANHRRKEILTRVRHGILFWFVLGLSWFFGFLSAITVDSTTFVFDYLYCVFTALQGFMMFLLLCVANPEFRKIFQRFSMRGDLTQTDSSNLTAQRSTIIKRRTSGSTIKSISSGNSESQA